MKAKMMTNNIEGLEDGSLFEAERELRAVMDCPCPIMVAGLEWMKSMILILPEDEKQKVTVVPSTRVYNFGGSLTYKSRYQVKFPCCLEGIEVNIRAEVVAAEIPLLLGNSSLKAANAVLNIGEKKARILGREVSMKEERLGRFSLRVSRPILNDKKVKVFSLEVSDDEDDGTIKKKNGDDEKQTAYLFSLLAMKVVGLVIWALLYYSYTQNTTSTISHIVLSVDYTGGDYGH